MNIKKIINKTHLEQSEMQYVVEQYIKEKKGVDVEINLLKGVSNDVPEPFIIMHLRQQLQLLVNAFEIACKYFANKQ